MWENGEDLLMGNQRLLWTDLGRKQMNPSDIIQLCIYTLALWSRSAGLSIAQSKTRNVKWAKVFFQEKKNEERNYNFWVLQKLEICFWYNDIVGLIFYLTYIAIIRSLAIIHVWELLWAVNLWLIPRNTWRRAKRGGNTGKLLVSSFAWGAPNCFAKI